MKKIIISGVIAAASVASASAGTPASFPGGQDAMTSFFAEKIQYPQDAIDNMIEGTVTVNFTVETDGSVKNVKIVRPLDPDLEAEALRVVAEMPAWTPATDDAGNAISQNVEIPVKFRLPQ